MWTFYSFNTQILREINFGDSESAKSANFTYSEALNFDSYEFLHFLKAEISLINKIQKPKIAKNSIFRTFEFLKIDFT